MKQIILVVASLICLSAQGQMVHDFTVTDTDGVTHNIYTDHLNHGQTVVLKLFFVNCPPCNAIAPSVQNLYEQWGEGEYDVEFFEVTTISADDDNDVIGYKNTHGITFPGISDEGNASAVVNPIKAGDYGPYFGTPSFAVIAPDGTMDYGVSFSNLDAAIAATGATGSGSMTDPTTTYQVNFAHPAYGPIGSDYLTVSLHPAGTTNPIYNITDLTNGTHQFDYPSDEIPEMLQPTLTISSNAPANTGGLSVLDVIKIRKHILGFEEFQEEWRLIASDVSGEGNHSVLDIVTLRKVILGFQNTFPNLLPGQAILNNNIPLVSNPGQTVEVEVLVVKRGDVN